MQMVKFDLIFAQSNFNSLINNVGVEYSYQCLQNSLKSFFGWNMQTSGSNVTVMHTIHLLRTNVISFYMYNRLQSFPTILWPTKLSFRTLASAQERPMRFDISHGHYYQVNMVFITCTSVFVPNYKLQ
jgi:hypothetical protein